MAKANITISMPLNKLSLIDQNCKLEGCSRSEYIEKHLKIPRKHGIEEDKPAAEDEEIDPLAEPEETGDDEE